MRLREANFAWAAKSMAILEDMFLAAFAIF